MRLSNLQWCHSHLPSFISRHLNTLILLYVDESRKTFREQSTCFAWLLVGIRASWRMIGLPSGFLALEN